MQATFVDLGLSKNAFLPYKDVLPKIDVSKAEDCSRNSNLVTSLKKGQNLLLQIRKEAFEDKGARVSTHITLAGKYLVLMPDTDIITISQKIIEVNEKERLLNLVKRGIPKGFGCIIRTEAENVSDDELVEDFKKILEQWNFIKSKFKSLISRNLLEDKDRLIYNDNDIAVKIARDMVKKNTKKIYVNDKESYEAFKFLINNDTIQYK